MRRTLFTRVGVAAAGPSDARAQVTRLAVVVTLALLGLTAGQARAQSGRLGVELSEVRMLEDLGAGKFAKNYRALYIRGVRAGSPAALAGLRDGDVIIQANFKQVTKISDLQAAVAQTATSLRLVVYRGPNYTQGGVVMVTLPSTGAPDPNGAYQRSPTRSMRPRR